MSLFEVRLKRQQWRELRRAVQTDEHCRVVRVVALAARVLLRTVIRNLGEVVRITELRRDTVNLSVEAAATGPQCIHGRVERLHGLRGIRPAESH